MITFVIAGLMTLFLGPFMFAYLSARYSEKHRYPVGLADSIGDGLFLVLFNAYAFGYGMISYIELMPLLAWSLAFVSILFGLGMMIWRRDFSDFNDWSRPKKGYFNPGGYYHSAFLTVQSFIVIFSLAVFHSMMLYLLFLCYAITFIIHEYMRSKKTD
jgi:hypothetical protein